MTKKIAGILLAVLVAALPLAVAAQNDESAEGAEAVAVAATAVAAPAEDGEARREVRVVLVENGEVKVIEDEGEDGPHRALLRLVGEGDVHRVHAGDRPFFRTIEGRGYLGVHLVELTPELRAHFGAGGDAGLLVGRVEPGSPAERAGVRVGDVLTRVGGEEVSSHFEVLEKVRPLTAGQGVALEVRRDGRVEVLSATVAEREQPQLEVGTLLRRLGEEGEIGAWEIDPEELERRMGAVTEYFASPEWRERVHTLTVTGEGLEERLDELEREIERLNEQIQEQNERIREQSEELP